MPLNRREFLTSTAALPLLAISDVRPVFADAPRRTPAYLALQKFIQPGLDEFPEEKEAARIVAELDRAFRSGNLPNELTGHSPFPASYRSIAPGRQGIRIRPHRHKCPFRLAALGSFFQNCPARPVLCVARRDRSLRSCGRGRKRRTSAIA